MSDNFWWCMLSVVVGFFACIVFLTNIDKTYFDGQVDALTGNIKVEKVTHGNQTVTWQWIKEDK